ncbi:MAG: PDZ domain-containing protein [Phycisphaerales bacterium]
MHTRTAATFTTCCLTPALLVLSAGAPARADVDPTGSMMRWPDVSATSIVFSYANDLWIVPRTGGTALPLASPPGPEALPKFSPDGQTIAFIGNYEGNRDVYTIPVTGGVAVRVTHHPAGEILSDFSPDGSKIMYLTNGFAGLQRQTQLWSSPAGGGMPTKLPVPYAGFGSVSPDGTWLAYTPHSTDTRTWKRYRGGMATDVWIFNLTNNSARKITNWEGTDTIPMWIPGGDSSTVYYLTDNGPDHRLNIWSFGVNSGERAQITTFSDDDVRWPSIGPGPDGKGEIVFQLGAKLMLLNLATRQSSEVNVTIPGDRPKVRDRLVDASKNIAGASISPSAKRVVIEGRGDLWSVPAKEGVTRALTYSDGIAERDPSWSPDGKWIAYFSDESGEYELWVRPSDARPADEKKDAKKPDEKTPDGAPPAKADDAAATEPRPQPRKLTSLGAGFRFNPTWSPDSTMISFTDQNGRLYLTTVASGDTKEFDKDPWMNQLNVSWSHDSRWFAYSKADDGNSNGCIWIGDAKTGQKHQVTSNMFASTSPAFDRKGDWLFFASNRSIEAPEYSDLDTTFVYADTDTLLMAPLRADVKSPWLPKSDEEELKKDAKKDQNSKGGADKQDEKKDSGPPSPAAVSDPVTGTWSGKATGDAPGMENGLPFTMSLKLDGDNISGSMTSAMGSGDVSGTFDKASGHVTLTITIGDGVATLTGTIDNGQLAGTWTTGDASGKFTATRSAKENGEPGKKDADGPKKDDKPKDLMIDFDGFEGRAIMLPVRPGGFANLAVADGEKLVYSRRSARGTGVEPGIKVFDYSGDEKEEKAVTAGGNFQLTADGKKMLVFRGGSMAICDPSAGGGKSQAVATDGMKKTIDPRKEWEQIFTDAWRLQRDYFYEPGMHGVDWPKMRQHYGAMLPDAASREDVNWIISEMISELNIGHAYLQGQGDVEDQPTVGVGLLGCDFELDAGAPGGGAYKIARIYQGGPWDADARGPLSEPGVNVKVGDYLLEVNGIPINPKEDPYAAFVGAVGKTIALTVNSSPTMDGKEREVLVKPIGSEASLRFRAWIEDNRAYVDEKSGGTIGYIYVPNTGVDGQSELFRQFFGQRQKDALIIDERWNGGGQIPTRFIELLNRQPVNYWARRDGNSWPWPPDAHFGPKCMLINGLAGSGGDDFPWLFKHEKIGTVIGTRTWGGLVGISGNPRFIDGGSITVPTFGFFELDGTWGVEGHGVDPDMVVVDDPSLMVSGGDPQLDAAIAHLTDELKTRRFVPPQKPASPDRRGMGLPERDR